MATVTRGSLEKIEEVLGSDARDLLEHKCQTIPKDQLHLPGGDFVDRIWKDSDRPTRVLRSLESMLDHGRLAGTGYFSILPVDQGIEHTAGASFAPNPIYFDGAKIVELAIEGECNAVASTFGVLGSVARRYAHKIPFICKLNHNELLTFPNHYDQILFGTVKEAWEMGAVAVAPPSTSARRNPIASSRRSHLRSRPPMSSAWRPCCGATCATRPSRKTV